MFLPGVQLYMKPTLDPALSNLGLADCRHPKNVVCTYGSSMPGFPAQERGVAGKPMGCRGQVVKNENPHFVAAHLPQVFTLGIQRSYQVFTLNIAMVHSNTWHAASICSHIFLRQCCLFVICATIVIVQLGLGAQRWRLWHFLSSYQPFDSCCVRGA